MLKSNLKVLLAIKDINQRDLSKLTGIREQTISNIINNKIKQIPVKAACQMCELFDCQLSDIWTYIPDNKE